MMRVARDFKTPARKFCVGTAVTAADIDGPVAFDDWVAGGFVASDEPEPAAEVVEPVAEPDAPLLEDNSTE